MVDPVDKSELKTVKDYDDLELWLDDLRMRTKHGSEWQDAMRWMCLNDLYFLQRYVLNIGRGTHQPTGVPTLAHQLYIDMARATELHVSKGKGLMCSARRAGKSELRTCALPIQLMLKYPNISMSIFSGQKYLAIRHLVRIKNELERCPTLQLLFNDVLWENPLDTTRNEGIKWSISEGLVIKGRTMNRSTSTIEVNALGSGPGSGYDVIFFDDIEWEDTVVTQEASNKADKEFSSAINLMTPVVVPFPIAVVNNTVFSEIGLIWRKKQQWMAEDKELVFEVPAEIVEEEHEWCEKYVWDEEDVGPMGGKVTWPFNGKELSHYYNTMENRNEYALQRALTLKKVGERTLNMDLIHFYEDIPSNKGKWCNVYVLIDPSKGKRDPSAIWVWGLTNDKRFVWLDATISFTGIDTPKFHDNVFATVMKWKNLALRVVEVRVEDTGNSDWSALVERNLRERGSWVSVRKVKVHAAMAERKFKTGKHDRIWARWSPALHRGDVWFPKPTSKGGRGILCEMQQGEDYKDLVDYVISVEMRPFPGGKHDDGIDAACMIWDEKTNQDHPLQFPTDYESGNGVPVNSTMQRGNRRGSWMSGAG